MAHVKLHGGQNHDQGGRMNMRYYSGAGHDMRTENDWKLRYVQVQKRYQTLSAEQMELQSKVAKLVEERDKAHKKIEHSSFMLAQQGQMKSYVQRLKFEKEQLDQQLRLLRAERNDKGDLDMKYRQLLDELKRTRSDLDCAIQDRDDLKYQVTELKRENQRLGDKLQSINPNFTASRRELESLSEQRVQLNVTISELQTENQQLRDEVKWLSEKPSGGSGLQEDVLKLKEENLSLISHLQESKKLVSDLEAEVLLLRDKSPAPKSDSGESLNRQSSEESLGGLRINRSMGRIGEDFPPLGRSHSNSISELEKMAKGVGQERLLLSHKKKLSASTNNLWEERGGRDQIVQQLQSQLNRVFKEKEILSQKCSSMREARAEMEARVRSLEEEREFLKEELGKSKVTTKNEMEILKGVALQQTSETYEKSMHLQTQLLELQTEKALIEKQRDITLKERGRAVTDAISMKKKLEAIKAQRQKDAKELAAMRKHKDKTEKENGEVLKQHRLSSDSLKKVQSQLAELVENLKPLFHTPDDLNSDNILGGQLQRLVSQLKQEHSDLKSITRLVYGRDDVDGVSSTDMLAKIEALFHEKSDLVLEIEDLQKSASKLNEERIFDLKQTIETLYMEQDVFHGKNCSLMSRVGKLEAERDKLRQECERLDNKCQDLNATLSSPIRMGNIMRNSAQHHWEETWEMKHVQVPLGSKGKAGFSVVGGRDQPQLPNPGSFIVTNVNRGGPAEGKLRVGDVLENVNGIDLQNADHSTAVHAVKESKGLLDIVLRRRKKAHALQVGVAGAIVSLGEEKKTKKEQNEFSLLLQKEGTGFTWEWEAHYTVTGINEGGPAYMILQEGDRIMQINGTSVAKEKPSAVKKLLKPHKGVLRLVVEREVEQKSTHYLTSEAPPPSVQEILTPSRTSSDQGSGSSSLVRPKVTLGGGSSWGSEEASQNSFDHSATHNVRPTTYYSSQDSMGSQEPVKMVDKGRVRPKDRYDQSRPTSDGIMYGYEKKVGFENYSSEIGSTGYSESVSESFLSEPSSYPDDCLPLDSSQTSIELTFHSASQVSQHRLTVQSTVSTLPDKESNSDDEPYFARDDGTRTTFRTRSGSDGSVNQYPEIDSKSKKSSRRTSRRKLYGLRSGSLSQLSEPEYEQYVDPSAKRKSRSKSMLAVRGKSRSNLSLTPARSMTSVLEEPRRSMSITSMTSEHDPLADATYIRANFSYIPRHPQEISIKSGDVFHIIEEAPSARHRRSFWVSRLNADGTDSDVGAIPNSSRAQEWLDEQGEASDLSVYEEVEPFTGIRPVIVCGVLANQITNSLAESYPNMFYHCKTEFMEGTARITEARLNRERSEGNIIDYHRIKDSGYSVIPKGALTSREHKGKCALMFGSLIAVQSLKKFAPPISVLIKAGAEDSIRAFGYDGLSFEETQHMYADARMMDEQHSREFTACLTLVFEETLLKQIYDIVKHEKHNQTWVPVNRINVS